MNKSERLAQFLEWVKGRDTSLGEADLRLLAVALLDESGGGRVNESHILAASDRHAGVGGDDAVAKVHEVGELFLAFEASTPRRPSRNLEVSLANEAVQSEVAPPAARPPSEPTPVAAGEKKSTGQQKALAAGTFRCPHCETFVTMERGKCPKCGHAAPKQIKMPSKWRPSAGQDSSSVLPILAVGVLLIGGSVLAMRWVNRTMDESSGTPVAGPYAVGSLDLQVVFPTGWREARGPAGSATLAPGLRGRLASFYRGGTQQEPENLLVLAGARRADDEEEPLADDDLKELAGQVAASAKTSLRREATFDPEDCTLLELGTRRVARCPGEAPGDQNALVYAWSQGDRVLAAYAVGRADRDQLIELAEEVVSTAEVVAPPAPPPAAAPAEEADGEPAAPEEVPPP